MKSLDLPGHQFTVTGPGNLCFAYQDMSSVYTPVRNYAKNLILFLPIRMPYTQAVILEILRIASPVPMTMRATADKTDLEGYPLQKVTSTSGSSELKT